MSQSKKKRRGRWALGLIAVATVIGIIKRDTVKSGLRAVPNRLSRR